MENIKSDMLVTSTPHIRKKITINQIMLDVIIALLPATVMAVFYFKLRALLLIMLTVISCVIFEYLFQKLTKRKIRITDFSAVVTGLLLAFNLPAAVPFWVPIVGSFFAIIIVKQLFGGLGQNFMNPALGARAFLLAAYPSAMTDWSISPAANVGIDAVTAATPLAEMKMGLVPNSSDLLNAFVGNIGGTIGETCAIALLIGGIYLIARKVISWRTPVAFIGTVFILSFVFGRSGLFTGFPLYETLIGGVMLGAFFMATDYSTCPVTPLGKIIMGVGCGIITVVIRNYGSYPEGVSYSILLMNLVVPLIDKFTKPRVYGEVAKNA